MGAQESEQRTYRIKGMGCQGCADTVQQALADVDGVESAEVSLEDETALVFLATGGVTETKLAQHVKDAGYELVAD